MPMTERLEVARRTCPVIFLLDTSGSMSGTPIGAVNAAMEGILPELVSLNKDNPDAEIEIAILTFESGTKWVTGNKLVPPQDFAWNDLNTGGLTSMGAAFEDLNKALSVSNGFMRRASGCVAPVLFLLSDGDPTDNYQQSLQVLKENNWYKVAIKVAIGYGEESNDDVLREFTGHSETVLHTNDPQDLKKMIRTVAIKSSMVASSRRSIVHPGDQQTDLDDPNKLIIDEIRKIDLDEEW
ncbi:MAG: VWA domain-containing protein [Planctomycetia bacterium]|nr:VWA domain-containing protein [Planctomycetia bacterium]